MTDTNLTVNTLAEFKGCIVDVFEDYFNDKGVEIENENKDDYIDDEDDEYADSVAIIFGDDYDAIGDEIAFFVEENNLFENKTTKTAIEELSETILAAVNDILSSRGNIDKIPDDDAYDITEKITDTFEKWGLITN